MKIHDIKGQWYKISCDIEDTHFLNRILVAAIKSGNLNADDEIKADVLRRILPTPTDLSKMIDTDGVENIGYGKIFTHLNYKEAMPGKLYCYSNSLYEICEYPETCERSVLSGVDDLIKEFLDAHNVCHEFCREVKTTRLKDPTNILEEK